MKTETYEKHEICYYCKLADKRVEAGGIWGCPNPLCPSVGSHWFRCKLDSFKDCGDHVTHDPEEWLRKGMKYIDDMEDKVLRDKILALDQIKELGWDS